MHKLNKHANLSQETCFMTNLQAETLEILLVVGPKTTTPINTKIDSHNSITCKWLSLQPPMRNQFFQVTQHEEDTVTVSQDTTTTTSNTMVLSIAQCATS